MSASNNHIFGNVADTNPEHGITVDSSSAGNIIVKNHATLNVVSDMDDESAAGANTWNPNNICDTQSGSVPPGVCNPGEM